MAGPSEAEVKRGKRDDAASINLSISWPVMRRRLDGRIRQSGSDRHGSGFFNKVLKKKRKKKEVEREREKSVNKRENAKTYVILSYHVSKPWQPITSLWKRVTWIAMQVSK